MTAKFYQDTTTGEIVPAGMVPTARLADFRPYKGPIETETPCDARCTGAKGPDCNCMCGGLNHGRDLQLASGQTGLF